MSCTEIENTPADEMLVSELATSVQEVDVVVLPSLLQSDVSKKAVKKTKKVQKQETGNKQGQFDEKLKITTLEGLQDCPLINVLQGSLLLSWSCSYNWHTHPVDEQQNCLEV